MKYILTKEQFVLASQKLISSLFGNITAVKSGGGGFTELFDKTQENFADVWHKVQGKDKRSICKNKLTIHIDSSRLISNFIPIVKKKLFTKVFFDYIYEQTKINCDCIEYYHNFRLVDTGNEEDYDERFIEGYDWYMFNKKKTIKKKKKK